MEFVFVVPRAKLFRDHYPQGLRAFGPEFPLEAFESAVAEHGFFVERAYAEQQPDLKQVIPYSIAMRGEEVLLLQRRRTGGDRRLHDKLSIGVGGHINPEDLEPEGLNNGELETGPSAAPASGVVPGAKRASGDPQRNPIRAGSQREIEEELHVHGSYELRPVGIINDDSNPVGAVHVGIVQVLTADGSLGIREKDVLEGRLVPPGELVKLRANGANFETWSAILIDQLDRILHSPLQAVS